MENIDIKALARELKKTAAKNEDASRVASAPPNKVASNHPGRSEKTDRSSKLKSIISQANQRVEFVLTADTRIDVEVHDILKQLKGRTPLVIGNLASMLLEEFIKTHKPEIVRLIKPKPNRLMK